MTIHKWKIDDMGTKVKQVPNEELAYINGTFVGILRGFNAHHLSF